MDNDTKWAYITIIIIVVMSGSYGLINLVFDRLDKLQAQSQVVITK